MLTDAARLIDPSPRRRVACKATEKGDDRLSHSSMELPHAHAELRGLRPGLCRRVIVTALALTCVAAVRLAPGTAQGQSRALDDGRQWLEPTSPPATSGLVRGAAASALNQTALAETLLRSVIRAHPASEESEPGARDP